MKAGGIQEPSFLIILCDAAATSHVCEGDRRNLGPGKQASFLLFNIANRHPFVDGNKRTAVLVAELVLGADYSINVTAEELNDAVRKISAPDGNLECTERWLRNNINKIG